VSENIYVRSIVGRFLEHTRIYYFENNGDPEVFASSADLMPRNLYKRVEVAFPLETKLIRDRVITDLLNYLKDNVQAWVMRSDGRYERLQPGEQEAYSAQLDLLKSMAEVS
jgi:polyphosphate kinase